MALFHLGFLRIDALVSTRPVGPERPHSAPLPLAPPAPPLRPVCAWCGRVQRNDGTWSRPVYGLLPGAADAVTHVLCGACLDRYYEAPVPETS